MKMKKEVKTMKTIEVENINVQIQELMKLITDLRMMRLTTETVDLLKEYKELYIEKNKRITKRIL